MRRTNSSACRWNMCFLLCFLSFSFNHFFLFDCNGSYLIEYIKFYLTQAIHNQAEMNALCKKLESCIEEKDKLER